MIWDRSDHPFFRRGPFPVTVMESQFCAVNPMHVNHVIVSVILLVHVVLTVEKFDLVVIMHAVLDISFGRYHL